MFLQKTSSILMILSMDFSNIYSKITAKNNWTVYILKLIAKHPIQLFCSSGTGPEAFLINFVY